jgi:hypothetical protein
MRPSVNWTCRRACSAQLTHAGEDEHVVGLPDDMPLAGVLHVVEGAARRHDGPTASPLDGLFRRALCLAGRVAEREHDRTLHNACHALEHLLRERTGLRRGTDQDRGLHGANHVQWRKGGVRIQAVLEQDRAGHRELVFVRLVDGAAVVQQASAVEREQRAPDRGLAGAVGAHRDRA